MKRSIVFLVVALMTALIGCSALQGRIALVTGDFSTAIKELRPNAEQGDIESQWVLGSAYANAAPPIQDLMEAEKWLRRAAEQGHVGAMVDMAKLSLFYKPDKDERTAVLWYQKAANQGDPEAQFMVGSYHFSGSGSVPQDNISAYMWWILSAEKNHSLAKFMLEKSKDKISQEQINEAKQRAREWKLIK